MKKLYLIAGCNGAGKTTASYTILPDIVDCQAFVNADEIAKGLSPFQPEKVGIEAGKLMLKRIKMLIKANESFAFETTLATRSYVKLINNAKEHGYEITCVFFWLYSDDLAVFRVKNRVKEGGHDIPKAVIRRRYTSGLKNIFNLYLPILDNWLFVDNSGENYEIVAEGSIRQQIVHNQLKWNTIQ